MTVLASLFDALRRYRKEQGRTLIKFIQDYLSDGRLVRILGGDGVERYVPLIRDNTAIDADVVVDEAPSSVSQKERTFEILMQMLPNMANMGCRSLLSFWTSVLFRPRWSRSGNKPCNKAPRIRKQCSRCSRRFKSFSSSWVKPIRSSRARNKRSKLGWPKPRCRQILSLHRVLSRQRSRLSPITKQ